MGTLTDAVISTTYKKLVFQKTDNKIYYTNGSDVDTEITTFASALTLSGLITATAGIKLGNGTIFDSGNSFDLASKIEEYYNNPKEYLLKTKLAKKNIKRFTLRKNILGYENLFNKL